MELVEFSLLLAIEDVQALMPAVAEGFRALEERGRLSGSTRAACERLNDFRLQANARELASGREHGRELTRVAGVLETQSASWTVESLARHTNVTSDRVRQWLRTWETSGRSRLLRCGRSYGLIPADVAAEFIAQSRKAVG